MELNETFFGIELGSTRIKAVLIDQKHRILASGEYSWENRFEKGIWTYSLDDIWQGIHGCYAKLKEDVKEKYGSELKKVGAIGVSGMMHGYMAFDKNDNLLAPFKTWRNTITGEAAKELTQLFGFNIPQRWSIAHLYQCILNKDPHVPEIKYLTTLAGYIHWQLTGEKVLGVGDVSGMFPINSATNNYDVEMMEQFDRIIPRMPWKLVDIMPRVAIAGEHAGWLTENGAKRLDSSGTLQAGIPMCPPEGDAGTGMVATNSVGKRTGNISAGTSVFAMIVLENRLKKVHAEVDMVTTPAGDPVAMVHCNNCLGDLDAWVKLLGEAGRLLGADFDNDILYKKLFNCALEGEVDCGGLLSYNYISGEHVTELDEGRPMFIRTPDASLTLSNFIRTHLYSALASVKIGMRILIEEEGAILDSINGHGGFFKTTNVGLHIMSAALGVPVTVMETAGEGGAWGIAILAAYMANKKSETLAEYLNQFVFIDNKLTTVVPNALEVKGYTEFMQRYEDGLEVERKAVERYKLSSIKL